MRVMDLRFRLPLTSSPKTWRFPNRTYFSSKAIDSRRRSIRSICAQGRCIVYIESPLIELDIQGLSRPANKKSATLALRHLNMRDGRIL